METLLMMSRRPPNLTEPTKLQLIRAQHVHLGGPWKCILQVLPPVLCRGLYSVSYPPTRRVLAYINLRTGAQLCVIHPLQPAGIILYFFPIAIRWHTLRYS
jgi:hypothetical protein